MQLSFIKAIDVGDMSLTSLSADPALLSLNIDLLLLIYSMACHQYANVVIVLQKADMLTQQTKKDTVKSRQSIIIA